jgi:DNA-directed RNA polymerase subunit L
MSAFSFKNVMTTLTKKDQEIHKIANRYSFEIHHMDLAIVNSMRRVILAEIPMLGFMGEDDVSIKIEKNNGPLHNEFMIHRIGMIPIHFTEEELEGFVENEWEFSMDLKNVNTSIQNVTTHDFKGKHNGIEVTERDIKRLFPVNSVTKRPILLTRLRQGEELAFKAMVVKKVAKDHASFSAVSLCAFFYVQDSVKNKDVKDILQKERNYLKNDYGEPTILQFAIEPETGLEPKYIVAKSLEILRTKTETIDRELDVQGSTKIELRPHEEIADTYDLHVFHEDDTFGNLFQSIIHSEFIRQTKKILDNKFEMTYIGYYAPHPLDPKIVIRMTLKNSENIRPTAIEFKAAYKHCLRLVSNQLKEVYDAWIRFE